MQNNNQMIAVWGNPHSGKTTTAVKLACELAKKKNVILVLCDNQCPTAMTILPGKKMKDCSLGSVLTAPQITQDQILKNCIDVDKVKNLAILGYMSGENDMTYAEYTRERAIDLFILLRHLADYVIIDCMSNVIADLLTAVALEVSDVCLRVSTADLKGMFFFQSNLPLLADGRYHTDRHIKILSNVRDNEPRDLIAGEYHGVFAEIPHTAEVIIQYLEGRLFHALAAKKSSAYRKSIEEIMAEIVKEEIVPEDKKEASFGKIVSAIIQEKSAELKEKMKAKDGNKSKKKEGKGERR